MRSTLPTVRVRDHVTFQMASSRGGDPYPVTAVHPGAIEGLYGVACPCKGYHHHGHCRHGNSVHGWLTAVIPPGHLPE